MFPILIQWCQRTYVCKTDCKMSDSTKVMVSQRIIQCIHGDIKGKFLRFGNCRFVAWLINQQLKLLVKLSEHVKAQKFPDYPHKSDSLSRKSGPKDWLRLFERRICPRDRKQMHINFLWESFFFYLLNRGGMVQCHVTTALPKANIILNSAAVG